MKFIQPRLNYEFTLQSFFKLLKSVLFFKKAPNSKINSIFNTDSIYFFDHARSGLKFILELLPSNSIVGVQPLTCPTVLEAIVTAKCKVCFIDINRELVIDEKTLFDKIEKIDVVILTHTFGYPANASKLKDLMKNKLLIEDCAHSFLSTSNKALTGLTGDFSIFSYGFAKFPSSIRGGYVVLNNSHYSESFIKEYERLGSPTFFSELKNILVGLIFSVANKKFLYSLITLKLKKNHNAPNSYVVKDFIPMKGLISSRIYLEGSLSDIQIKLEKQKLNALKLKDAIEKNPDIQLYHWSNELNCFMLPVRVENPIKLISMAQTYGIELGRHFYRTKDILPYYGYKNGDCPCYETEIEHMVTLPTHYNYPDKEFRKLLEIIEKYSNE